MSVVLHSAPKFASNEGVIDTLSAALGPMLLSAREQHAELIFTVARDAIEDALRLLRDDHAYQQLMEIAGIDYPQRVERFEVAYCLLSLTIASSSRSMLRKPTACRQSPLCGRSPVGWNAKFTTCSA